MVCLINVSFGSDFGILCFQRAPFPVHAVTGMLPKERGPAAAPLGCVLEAPAGWRLLPAPGTAAGSPSTAFNCSWGLDLPFIHEPGAAAPIQTHGWEPTGRAGVSLALLHCSRIRAGARAAAALADFEAPLNLSLSPPVIPKTPVLQAALCWCCKCCAATGKQTWK